MSVRGAGEAGFVFGAGSARWGTVKSLQPPRGRLYRREDLEAYAVHYRAGPGSRTGAPECQPRERVPPVPAGFMGASIDTSLPSCARSASTAVRVPIERKRGTVLEVVDIAVTYAVQLLAIVLAFSLLTQVVGLAFALVMAVMLRGSETATHWVIVVQNAVVCYLLASIVAFGALAWVTPGTSTLGLVGVSLVNFVVVLFTLQGSIHERQKEAARDGEPFNRFGTYVFDVAFSWLAAILSVVGIFVPGLVVNAASVLVVGAVLWVLSIPIVSWLIKLVAGFAVMGGLFTVLIVLAAGLYVLVSRIRKAKPQEGAA
jgi:hypothetical protein